jgi:hypothetical protein
MCFPKCYQICPNILFRPLNLTIDAKYQMSLSYFLDKVCERLCQDDC